jgi:hypothetical protein
MFFAIVVDLPTEEEIFHVSRLERVETPAILLLEVIHEYR